MRTGLRRLTVLLLVSVLFAAAGLFLYGSAYKKSLCVLAALNQADTLKSFPHAVGNGEVSAMPLYHVNPAFSGRGALKGFVIGSYYGDSVSERQAEIKVSGGPFSDVRLCWIFDARVRR